MVLKLYYDLLSQPSRALYIFLKLTRLPFEECPVDLFKGEHRTEEFKQTHSKFQKVPFIHDGDFRLTESIGIMRYLTREYPIEDHWYPKDSKKQARVDEYLEWQHLNVRLNCSTFLIANWVNPMKTGKKPPLEKYESTKKYMIKSLSSFEELFLSDNGPFLMGKQISYADIQAACEIEQPKIAGYDPMAHFPKIKTWIELVRKECNPYYDEAHEMLNMLAENNTTKAKL